MHRLSRQKKEQVEQFIAITNAPEKLALNCLEVIKRGHIPVCRV